MSIDIEALREAYVYAVMRGHGLVTVAVDEVPSLLAAVDRIAELEAELAEMAGALRAANRPAPKAMASWER